MIEVYQKYISLIYLKYAFGDLKYAFGDLKYTKSVIGVILIYLFCYTTITILLYFRQLHDTLGNSMIL